MNVFVTAPLAAFHTYIYLRQPSRPKLGALKHAEIIWIVDLLGVTVGVAYTSDVSGPLLVAVLPGSTSSTSPGI